MDNSALGYHKEEITVYLTEKIYYDMNLVY